MQNQITFPDAAVLTMAFGGSMAVECYDLIYQDTNTAKAADQQADQSSEAANQALFASKFVGLSRERKLADQTSATQTLDVVRKIVLAYPCVSTTCEVGDMFAACEKANGTQLESCKIKKTTDASKAIAYAVRREAVATTAVVVEFIGRVVPQIFPAVVTPYQFSQGSLAAAGGDQAGAAAIVTQTVFVTGSDDAKGVALPAPAGDIPITVVNTVANKAVLVYPHAGEKINGGAGAAAVSLAAGKTSTFHSNGTDWYSQTGA